MTAKGTKLSAAAKAAIGAKNRAAWNKNKTTRRTRWTGKAKQTDTQRRAANARRAERRRDRVAAAKERFPEKLGAIERDTMRNGGTIVNADTLRRPTFVVITPAGRRIETLAPDLA
jgi:hypothetical protein